MQTDRGRLTLVEHCHMLRVRPGLGVEPSTAAFALFLFLLPNTSVKVEDLTEYFPLCKDRSGDSCRLKKIEEVQQSDAACSPDW